ncbi:hypothetical protein F4782DRAFT_531750 [Xylaria castorea]|nr:hypothetical protein F4782DRAFT_531750 [Xylaria castorea]
MSQGMANSIFEYLTCKNPELKHQNLMDRTLSREEWWLAPKRLVPWDEFNFQTMMKMFGKRLKTELMRNDRKLDYPAPRISLKTEGTMNGEDTVINILTRWTKPMVTTALETVDDVFHPVFWVPPSLAEGPSIASSKAQPEVVQSGEKSKPQPLRKCKGGIKSSTRLACEIKPGSMWTSKALLSGELVDEDGYWQKNKAKSREASPLVQVYNYCVKLNTRYGFLITSREILAVRVGPPLESRLLDSSEPSNKRTEQKLNELLYYQGVMEYAVVPWGNCRTKERYENLTINLTLWVLCILAGQDYRPDWNYKALLKQQLIIIEEGTKKPEKAKYAPDQRENASSSSSCSNDNEDNTEADVSEGDDQNNAIYHSFGPGIELPGTGGSLRERKRKRETETSTGTITKRRRNSDA